MGLVDLRHEAQAQLQLALLGAPETLMEETNKGSPPALARQTRQVWLLGLGQPRHPENLYVPSRRHCRRFELRDELQQHQHCTKSFAAWDTLFNMSQLRKEIMKVAQEDQTLGQDAQHAMEAEQTGSVAGLPSDGCPVRGMLHRAETGRTES